MIVAGGVYLEVCVSPPSASLFGSGGRAALGLASLSPAVTLHAFHPASLADEVYPNFDAFGVEVHLYPCRDRLAFKYLYPLAKPRITPIPLPIAGTVAITGEQVLRFGCLEGDFKVDADFAIYDPQSAVAPARFRANGSRATHLAIILNRAELIAATGSPVLQDAVDRLMKEEGADVVVVKAGPKGAMVFQPDTPVVTVPAYRTQTIYKIGSGDVFSAAFAHYWAEAGQNPIEAAGMASLHAADYVETRLLPFRAPPLDRYPMPATSNAAVSAIFDSAGASGDWLRSEVTDALAELSIHASPATLEGVQRLVTATNARPDVLLIVAQHHSDQILAAISAAQAAEVSVVAYVEGMAPTTVEALARRGVCVDTDLTTALYRIAWA